VAAELRAARMEQQNGRAPRWQRASVSAANRWKIAQAVLHCAYNGSRQRVWSSAVCSHAVR
jgi:hypothetical protein